MAAGQPWGGSYATERRRVAWLVFVIGLLLWYLLPRLELELARARWRSHGIKDYDITTSATGHGLWFCPFQPGYAVAVRDGEFRRLEGRARAEGGAVAHDAASCPGAWSVSEVFENIEIGTHIPSSPLLWQSVHYDPTYGFAREVRGGCMIPFLSPYCEGTYTVSTFRPVPPGIE